MTVYWIDVKRGQNLVLSGEEGHEQVIGGFRDTNIGIDAYAQTFGYDLGRSQKGFATTEDAKDFVESFRPWDLHGVTGVTIEHEARPASASESIDDPEPLDQRTESGPRERQRQGKWWEFWRRG